MEKQSVITEAGITEVDCIGHIIPEAERLNGAWCIKAQ
jgi:hypothetical protein